MLRRVLLAACIAVALLAGCRRTEPDESHTPAPPPPGLTKCNAGILKAVELTTLPEVLSGYYTACAELHSKAPCADAWRKAATLDTPTKQLALVSEECRKVYCPDLGAYSLDLCRPDFESTPETIEKGWGPFLSAVIEREGGEYAPQLYPSLLGFYARTKQLEATWTPPASDSAAPGPSAGAPASSGSASPPSPSAALQGSTAPPALAASAATATAKGTTTTKPAAATKPAAPKSSAP